MDSSWRIKFDSTLQSSMPSMSSSVPQEPRNQMEINSGQRFYQHVTQDINSTLHQRLHDPMPPNNSNTSSHKSNHTEQANSFLALLSGPPSLLQCDFQDLSRRKVFSSSRSVNMNNFGSEVPQTSGALISANMSSQSTRNGANSSAVPSRSALSSTSNGVSVLHGNVHACNFNLQNSDLAKVVNHHMLPGTEKVKDFPIQKGDCYGANSARAANIYNKNVQMPVKIPAESNSSISDQSSTILSGCPRVFCLDTGGYLLLSNTGLLGIVCSCHFSHTSVSKFCEHLGLCDINPGDAVRMESGETIAQWRKLYFEKFGIRVPEDQSGWDWPEGLLPTAGLVKFNATMPKTSSTSHLINPVGSSRGLSRCMDYTMFPKNPQLGQNSVTGLLHNKEELKDVGSSNFLFKHLIGASQNNMHDVAGGQRMEGAVSKSSTMSTIVGRDSDSGCQSMSAWIDSILKSGSSTLTHSSLQNSRMLGQICDVSAARITNDVVISDRDATSSNMELKLGQPYQQSRPAGNSALPVIAPKHLERNLGPPELCYTQRMNCHGTFRGEEESRQYCHHGADSSNPTAGRQQKKLNLGNYAFGVSSVVDATKLDKCRGDATKSFVVPPLPQLLSGESACSRGTNHMVGEFSMPNTFHCGYSATKCDPLSAPMKIANNSGRQLNMPELGFCRLIDKGKGAGSGCVPGGLCTATDPALGIQKQVEYSRIEPGVLPVFSAVHGTDSCQSSGIPSDRIDERSCLNLPGIGNSSFVGNTGHTDRAFRRMMSSYLGSGLVSQSSPVSLGFPLATSTIIPGPTSTISQQESICLLDDSMRLLALRQILESSKQHMISSVGMSHGLGRLDQTSNPSVQHSLFELSKSREERHGPTLPSKQNVFEGASSSVPSPAARKLIPMTGLNSRCDSSAFSQGISLCSREIDMPCHFSNEPFPNHSELRIIRGESITQSSEHAKCCQRGPCTYFQGNCICSAHAKCLEGYPECRVGRSHVTSKEEEGVCMSVASEFVRDHTSPKEGSMPLDQGGKVNGQLPRRIACHASQWRDVPCKQKEACKLKHMNPSAEVLDASGCAEGQHGDAGMHFIGSAANRDDSFKGQDMSNISSGCSAPVVTQASIEVNNMDSSTIDAGDNGYINGLIVDEGSGIDKCSSNDARESERSAEFPGVSCRSKIRNKGFSKTMNGQSSFSLLDELKLIDSLTWKKGKNQIYTSFTGSGRTNHLKRIRRGAKSGKRKRAVKFRMLDAASCPKVSFGHCPKDKGSPQVTSGLSKDRRTLIPPGLEPDEATHLIKPGDAASAKIVSQKRDLHGLYNDQDGEENYQPELEGEARFGNILEVSARKRLKRAWDSFENLEAPKPILKSFERTSKSNSLHSIKAFSSLEASVCDKKARPIVCGDYGEICSGNDTDNLRPAKIVPLSRILKNTEQCSLRKSYKPKSTLRKFKKKRPARRAPYFGSSLHLKKEEVNGFNEVSGCHVEDCEKTCVGGIKQFDNKSFILEKGKDDKSEINCSVRGDITYNWSKTRCKEIRKRSLYELTGKGLESASDNYPLTKISKCKQKMKVRKGLKKAGDVDLDGHRSCDINAEKAFKESRYSSIVDSDVFCSVCGSTNKDEFNCLLECSRCLIRVHQACYGVLKVPKGPWYCRPCRTSSNNIVCVLCGYGGGAMTRALRSHAFVKGLLKAWNIEAECMPKSAKYSDATMLDDQSLVVGNASCNLQLKDLNRGRAAAWKIDAQNQLETVGDSACPLGKLNVYNSVTAGVLDSTVKQWIHMVCGLWTPETRCPNVDTMSAFDVSGVSSARENVVCSICNRPGGSCIQCRVVDCSVRFHPWCAHQKGLLQSEVEGVDNENVGFYGRCMLHASCSTCESGSHPIDAELSSSRKGESTCARTEGFKGRKQDGFRHNIYGQSSRKSGCLVPQEQLNAWNHIIRQKSCMQGQPKLPTSDIEYDCRKEYARYKQAKGWKHLVVYKSGIHALGLYTSRFISRGEMVVEYVGEIVGLRVADKREKEYESGRKVQYKSACYFFRIDKEHIIDATRKGGIARFVNHSCLPNCVAKIISVRNEKKVVFFAERDIYPGEEITYDYHFNHEDEGKKIPCFCNSKNCRRYLN